MSESTRWSLVEAAARDHPGARERFARCYEPVVRAYLGARWRNGPLREEVQDAAQEVFASCFSESGPLHRVDPALGGFRGYLLGVVRNIARGFERKARARREVRAGTQFEPSANEDSLSQLFEREWARSLTHEAARLMAARAVTRDAQERLEVLRLRFEEGLPVRDIADRLSAPTERIHVAYARARREYKRALAAVVEAATEVPTDQVEAECARLLRFLG